MKSSREIDIMQFHLINALYIDGYIIKSGMNIIKRTEKGSSEYVIYHSDDFTTPYTSYPLNHVPALMVFLSKKLIDGGMMVIDEETFVAEEIKSGTLKLVEKTMHIEAENLMTPKFKVA